MRTNVGTIYGGFEIDKSGLKVGLEQSKSAIAKAALDMQRSSRIKIDMAEWKKLTSQLKALQARAQETRVSLLKATPGSDEAKKLQNELSGLEKRMRILKAATEPARKELERLARAEQDASKANKRSGGGAAADIAGALPGTFGSVASLAFTNPAAAAATAGVAATGALMAAGVATVKLGSDLEMAQVAFEGLFKSAEKAKVFIEQLREFGANTPFEMPGLLENTRLLMAFRFENEKIIPMLRVIGDTVSYFGGGTEQINRIVTALGQMKAKTKVSAEEMMQLTEAGIPAWEMLAKKIGVDVPTAMKMAEQGQIDAITGINALLEGMNESYAGGMQKLSQTSQGIWSTIVDTARNAIQDIGLPMANAIKPQMLNLIKQFQDAWPKIKSGIASMWSMAKPMLIAFWDSLKELWEIAKPLIKLLVVWDLARTIAAIKALTIAFKLLATTLRVIKEILSPILKGLNWIMDRAGGLMKLSNKTTPGKDAPALTNAPAGSGDFHITSATNGNSAAQTSIISSITQKMAEFNRTLWLNGDSSEYAAMKWATLKGEFKDAPAAMKATLLALAKQKDAQDTAREAAQKHKEEQQRLAEQAKQAAEQLANHWVQNLNSTLSAIRDWAGKAAASMKQFSNDVLDTVKDQIKKERDLEEAAQEDKKSRYEKLAELGAAGVAAMTGIKMFGKKSASNEVSAADITPSRLQAAFKEITEKRASEAAMQNTINRSLYGNSISRYEAVANGKTPDVYGVSAQQQITLLTKLVQLTIAQLDEIKRSNRVMVTS